MSAMAIENGPVRPAPRVRVAAVPNPQKERFAAAVGAKNYLSRGWDRVMAAPRAARGWVIRTFHLEPVAELAADGWTWTKEMIGRGADAVSRTIGLGPAIGLLASTRIGQNALGWGYGLFKSALSFLGRTLYSVVNWAARAIHLPGTPVENRVGVRMMNWADDKILRGISTFARYEDSVRTRLRSMLDPDATHTRLIRGASIFGAVRNLFTRWLPAPWNMVAGLVGGVFAARSEIPALTLVSPNGTRIDPFTGRPVDQVVIQTGAPAADPSVPGLDPVPVAAEPLSRGETREMDKAVARGEVKPPASAKQGGKSGDTATA